MEQHSEINKKIYYGVFKELEWSNLDIRELTETKKQVQESELQGQLIHMWSVVGRDKNCAAKSTWQFWAPFLNINKFISILGKSIIEN